MRKFVEGETVEQFGSVYLVERVYNLTDEEMAAHDIYCRTRVTLRKLSGENGAEVMGFGLSKGGC